jgi:hypothetical protein
MLTLSKYINDITPKFNKQLVEGFCWHRINGAINYIDNFIKYSCLSKTNTHLKYLGYKEVQPKDEIKFLFNKTSKVVHDIAENDIYLVKFSFQYGDEETIREHYFYLPYLNKGNIIHLSGNKFLVMPVLSDKVVSIGDKIIFINILTAKYSFTRSYFGVVVNDRFHRVPIVNTELYKNQVKKLEDTTKANTTVMHYMLANFGYSETMRILLGFVPKPVYDYSKSDKIIFKSTGNAPQGYIRNKQLYKPTNIKFLVDEKQYNEDVLYCVGNVFYILDNFPDSVSIDELDNTLMWCRLLGEIIHSGNHGLAYLNEKISAHFNDLNSSFDTVTISKLRDIDVDSKNLMDLLIVIFRNFNNWIMNVENRSLYYNKTYEVESFVLSHLTSRITRIVLDINKEELRVNSAKLDSKIVDKIFKKYFVTRAIFSMKKEKQYVTSIEYSGDHLYFKNTSMVVQQESDFININNPDVNTSERKKIVASMATVGSILGLGKKNPTPLIRANPYVNVDFKSGTILPHPLYNDIIDQTDRMLANIDINENIEDNDDYNPDVLEELTESDSDTSDVDIETQVDD